MPNETMSPAEFRRAAGMTSEPKRQADGLTILALDPATATGFAVGSTAGRKILDHGTWPLGGTSVRLENLFNWTTAICNRYGVGKVFFEEASFGGVPGGKSRIQWAVIVFHNKLRGVIELAAAKLCIPTQAVSPTTIKTMAGSGRADKAQMIRACKTILGIEPADENAADALLLLSLAMNNPNYEPETKAKKRREKTERKKEAKLF